MSKGVFKIEDKRVCYWPYRGNGYHELVAIARSPGVEIIAVKDGGDRTEAIGLQAEDAPAFASEVKRLAGVYLAELTGFPAPEDPEASVRDLCAAIVAALDVPYPADSHQHGRRDRIVTARTAGIIGALESIAAGTTLPGNSLASSVSAAADAIRKHGMKPPVGYVTEPAPEGQTAALLA